MTKQWLLFYVQTVHIGSNIIAEIKYKEFVDELDLLVWASEMHIPKKIGAHWIVAPHGVCRIPVEIYERIEHLTKQRKETELRAEEKIAAAARIVEQRKQRKSKQKQENMPCTQ